jgi:cytidylate kinase
VDYSKPKLYNDIVIDSSKINEEETFNLILKRLKDGRYIEKE